MRTAKPCNFLHFKRFGIGNSQMSERSTREGSRLAVSFALGSCGPG